MSDAPALVRGDREAPSGRLPRGPEGPRRTVLVVLGFVVSVGLAIAGTIVSLHESPSSASSGRDPLVTPFASTSIWNMPIGSDARYVPAGLAALPAGNPGGRMPQIDDEPLIMSPSAPPVPIQFSPGGFGKNRCQTDPATVLDTAPIPPEYVLPSTNKNQSAAILAADGRTVINVQPLARCAAGGPATSLVRFPDTDLYGNGIDGSHGGSGMSALGGSIRVGELRPGQQGPRHALKVNVYSRGELFRCQVKIDCSRWPARKSDRYAAGTYGSVTNNQNRAMAMGSLLALPPSVDIAKLGLATEPARQLAWTLQNYGAYIVDDTAGPSFAIEAEVGPAGSVKQQFQKDYGLDIEDDSTSTKNPWSQDVRTIRQALAVVDNNGPNSVGGGGTPRQPLLPPLDQGPSTRSPSPPLSAQPSPPPAPER